MASPPLTSEIRRADLPKQISEKVFSRMQTERAREAAEYRAQGSEQAQTITARPIGTSSCCAATRSAKPIRRGAKAMPKRNRIFAEGVWQGSRFFAFYRSMQAYEAGLKIKRHSPRPQPEIRFLPFLWLSRRPARACCDCSYARSCPGGAGRVSLKSRSFLGSCGSRRPRPAQAKLLRPPAPGRP